MEVATVPIWLYDWIGLGRDFHCVSGRYKDGVLRIMWQTILVLICFSIAAIFVGKRAITSIKAFFSNQQSGCAKCGFAQPVKSDSSMPPAIQRRNEIKFHSRQSPRK